MSAMVSNMYGIAGGIILLLVLIYLLINIVGTFRRALNDSRLQFSRFEHLSLRIERAREEQENEVEKSTAWFGTRKFEVVQTEIESIDQQICSFYLRPHDKKPIPSFDPGQFLTFSLDIPGHSGRIKRCYSLSDGPREGSYRVSIKRVPAPTGETEIPPGLSSNYFHDQVKVGSILDVRAPSGKFFLDTKSTRPVVLIGGGVGLTPVMSMLNATIAGGGDREVWFFYGVRNSEEHAMRAHLDEVAANHSNIRMHVCYSSPREGDVRGKDYDHHARVGVGLFKEVLPSNNYQFLMCGPPPMMESLVADLAEWGVPKKDILRESFGPASGRKAPPKAVSPNAQGPEITFKRSGKTARWDPAFDSLVKFAEANGCDIPYACLAGNCGTCLTTIIQGDVDYQDNDPDFEAQPGTCLACSCVPKGPIEIDA